ncbi:5-methylcytosine-specific restriction protein A [Planomicrobium stackebrandtii]|uniref:5-methylcytosine-specific restriction protein A n=1 Tax=Planomicrobium stackebrandtii TaxID=253160 RepID=A0ABU0GVN1_9BACL|nr:HNH endonuclease [Planomicrobium stackebrandtii]MDQ0429424.1 5-methylcytosine-specific restriction protein A [Planomicrobium stackebrandtii]
MVSDKSNKVISNDIIPKKNPAWKRDELILALDLYFKNHPNKTSNYQEEVLKLSEVLNVLPIHENRYALLNFRNPNSINMKMSNFLRLDPNYEGEGLKGGGKLEEEVWKEFYQRTEELSNVVNSILLNISSEKQVCATPEDSYEEEVFPEGKILYRLHRHRERNIKAVKEKKRQAIKENNLVCEICTFDFYKTYGELGEGYIECHHTVPISEYEDSTKTRMIDLVLVCANCHRMLHRKRPWPKKGGLKSIIRDV